MANPQTVMAMIRLARPPFRNNHDKVAFAIHASFIASGFVLTATGRPAFADNALSSSSSQDDVGIDGWNAFDGEYAFVYANPRKGSKKILVKCLAMGDKLLVDAIADGGAEPAHLEIKVGNYAEESNEGNYAAQFKNLDKLVTLLQSEILYKLDEGLKPVSSRVQSSSETTPRGGFGDGSMLVGPNDPRFFPFGDRPGFMGPPQPGVPPPGARFDPFGPPGVPGFEPGRFTRQPPRRSGGGGHPDLQHFPGSSGFI